MLSVLFSTNIPWCSLFLSELPTQPLYPCSLPSLFPVSLFVVEALQETTYTTLVASTARSMWWMQPKLLHHVAQAAQTGLLCPNNSAVKEQHSCKHIAWNKHRSVWAECSDELTHLSQHIWLSSPAPFWFDVWWVYITGQPTGRSL